MSDSAISQPKRLDLSDGQWVDVERHADVPDHVDVVRGDIRTWLTVVGHSDGLDEIKAIAAIEAAKLEWAAEVLHLLVGRPKVSLPVTRGGES